VAPVYVLDLSDSAHMMLLMVCLTLIGNREVAVGSLAVLSSLKALTNLFARSPINVEFSLEVQH
jgi:hypothetical protein